MKKSNIDPRCEYCEKSYLSKESGNLYCSKKGIVSSDDSCKKFKYDPLKRVPRKLNFSCDFSPEDFEL